MPIVLNENKRKVYAPRDNSIPTDSLSQCEIHKCIKSRTTTLFFWQTALQNMKMAVYITLSNTFQPHPALQLVSTCKKEKKNQKIQSVDEYLCISTFHSQRRVGLLDKIIKMVMYQGKFFLKENRGTEKLSERATPTSNWF